MTAYEYVMQLEIPTDRIDQVAFAFREKANEYHGAVARSPDDRHAPAWKATATWFDAQADALRDHLPKSMVR